MKVALLLSSFYFAIAFANLDDGLPTIHIKQKRSVDDIPSIDITFPDGFEDHMVLARHYMTEADKKANKIHCNFIGHLETEKDACVAVTGCPGDRMEFTVNSKHAGNAKRFILHKDGQQEKVESAFKPGSFGEALNVPQQTNLEEWQLVNGDEMENPNFIAGEMQTETNCAAGQCSELPPTNLMKVKVGYDDTFRADTGSATAVNNYLDAMFTHVQTFFCDPSLGSKIQIEVRSLLF